MKLKVGMVSLGCPKNLVDSEIILGTIKESGFEITNRENEADILVVNTCSFIEEAKKESIKNILSLARFRSGGKCRALLVAGCLAQRYPKELLAEMPEIDGVIGTGNIIDIPSAINRVLLGEKVCIVGSPGFLNNSYMPRIQSTPKHTAYLKIAEGCDNRCSYCIIPKIRGRYKSRPLTDIVNEAAALAGRGVKELILVAQDITRYGHDIYGKPVLDNLLKRLVDVEGLVWLRLLYTHPSLFNERLIKIISSEKKVCRYLDIPVQHASKAVLRRMNRGGSSRQIINLVNKLRAEVPEITLRTSLIVGFPGETQGDFEELLEFMKMARFERAGVFTYSAEEGTEAAEMKGQIPGEIKEKRRDQAMIIQKEISFKKHLEKIGSIQKVLVEERRSKRKKIFAGRGEGDAPDIDGKIIFKSNLHISPGDFVKVRISGARDYDLTGELIDEPAKHADNV